ALAKLGYDKLISADNKAMASDLTAEYTKNKTNIESAHKHLKTLPTLVKSKDQALWASAAEFIQDGLNLDTVGRLEKFLLFAQQHESQRADGGQPTQTPEEVLAIAVTGWLQGDQAAESDPKLALRLVRARSFLLEYLVTTGEVKRSGLISAYKSEK